MKSFRVIALGVFGIVFSLFVAVTGVFLGLPPGSMFDGIVACLVNGVVYGLIAFLIAAFVLRSYGAKPEPDFRYKPKPMAEVPKVMPEPEAEVPYRSEPEPDFSYESKTVPEVPKVTVEPKAGVPVIDVEGIGAVYADKLNAIGIYTTTDLLEAGGTPVGREGLSEKTEISKKLILEWVNLSDLMRIRGVGEEYSDLLEEAGVDTVVELSRRNPENLYSKMLEVNETANLVRKMPTLNDVISWVDQAKNLPRKIEY